METILWVKEKVSLFILILLSLIRHPRRLRTVVQLLQLDWCEGGKSDGSTVAIEVIRKLTIRIWNLRIRSVKICVKNISWSTHATADWITMIAILENSVGISDSTVR